MSRGGRVLHVDMDSFFVSVEVLKDPSLRGKPVVVGDPGPRGVVASASYEARRFGIRSAMAMAKARMLCPGLLIVPGSLGEYGGWSARVREILDSASPSIETASIDEFYLDLAGCERLHGSFFGLAARLARRIGGELGLPASFGLGANRTLAKIASKVAKPKGVLEVLPGAEEAFMRPLPVGLIPGIGPAAQTLLERVGVKTAGELADLPERAAGRVLGSWAGEAQAKARGLWAGDGVAVGPRLRKSIGHETTFDQDTADPVTLAATLFHLVEKAASRLRRKGLDARRVTVRVRFADFSSESRTRGLPAAVCTDQEIFRAAVPLLATLAGRRMRVRLVGVSLSDLGPASLQGELFRAVAEERRREACRCLDRLRDRFGFESVAWAAGQAGEGLPAT
jgi:DNA polymerase-4